MSSLPRSRLTMTGQPLMDAGYGLLVTGCPVGSVVDVVCTTDLDGGAYEAHASYAVDEEGTVDTTRQPSVGGTYLGVDPFGLWWSAEPVGPAPSSPPGAPVMSHVEVRVDGDRLAAAAARRWLAPGATAEPVTDEGIRGLFCRPAGPGPFPGVVAFGGSGGGLGPAAAWAPTLANHGHAVLAIAYFGEPGLPNALVDIEVEVVERAARWLLARPDVRGPTVAAIGASRGSELGLLAGALLPEVHAVVGIAPSGVTWSGLDATGPADGPAWTFRGEPLPYVPIGVEASTVNTSTHVPGPVALRSAFDPALETLAVDDPAVIPVEQIGGPVLLVSGRSDTMWPSTRMSDIAERRAAAHGLSHLITHVSYDGAGHMCAGVPGLPVMVETRHPLTGARYSFGGTRAANAHARIDSWPRIVAFLDAATPSDARDGGAEPGPLGN